jgi:hypothetical protein
MNADEQGMWKEIVLVGSVFSLKLFKLTKKNIRQYRARHELGTFHVHVTYSPHFWLVF